MDGAPKEVFVCPEAFADLSEAQAAAFALASAQQGSKLSPLPPQEPRKALRCCGLALQACAKLCASNASPDARYQALEKLYAAFCAAGYLRPLAVSEHDILFRALCKAKSLPMLEATLQAGVDIAPDKTHFRSSALALAIENGWEEGALCISQNMSPETCQSLQKDPGSFYAFLCERWDKWSNAALALSAVWKSKGADPNAFAGTSNAAIFGARTSRCPDALLFLAGQGADMNARDDAGDSAMHALARSHVPPGCHGLYLELFKALAKGGCDPNGTDPEGLTPGAVARAGRNRPGIEFCAPYEEARRQRQLLEADLERSQSELGRACAALLAAGFELAGPGGAKATTPGQALALAQTLRPKPPGAGL